MSRRDQIAMTASEVAAFLAEQRVVVCATNGPRGWPHLMPLWYVVRGEDIWAWTYAKSQKVRNLERDPRATLQVEDGEEYAELRGVMVEAHTEILGDLEVITSSASSCSVATPAPRPASCSTGCAGRPASGWRCAS
ncbi:MAG TPA: pyridoxamine 5'-phosphate oxidase family protein [Solirubrobacteraceae bacterium]|nr:pyridoxamine 5'-phosphate oxidase family protein [Solirubrobacteraceae bacterium]